MFRHDKLLAVKTPQGCARSHSFRMTACPSPRNELPFRRMLKTGLIQPETIPGQFPRNLRTIVELYRSCLDHGAELVICPPGALGGIHTGELALRSGFRSQRRAALAYLSREISEAPLLLGAADEKGIRFHLLKNGLLFPQEAMTPQTRPETEPALVFGIFRTEDEPGFSVNPWRNSSSPSSKPCLLLRAPCAAWHEGLLEREEKECRRMAADAGIPLTVCRLAGGEGPFLLPGASSLWSATGNLLGRLRLFERDFAVLSPEKTADHTSPLPVPEEQLRHALRKGTEDFILKTGHRNVCLNLMESPCSFLLARLLTEIRKKLPSLLITGFIPQLSGIPEQDIIQTAGMAETLDIRPITLPPSAGPGEGSLDERLTAAWRIRAWADEGGALLLSSLNGTDIMTDCPALRAALAADFMPMGDLYETELTALFSGHLPPAAETAARDELLARLTREHVSATHLTALHPEREQEIRRMQRQARASGGMRRKLPPRLILRSIPGTPEAPAVHQLMD